MENTKQQQVKEALVYLAGKVVDGEFGTGNDLDGESLQEALEELVEDEIPRITGYGK